MVAAPGFRLLATMNPGGDFGKKELSPALRNRFTEVWVPAVHARRELLQLLSARLHSAAPTTAGGGAAAEATPTEAMDVEGEWRVADAMLGFVNWLSTKDGARPTTALVGGDVAASDEKAAAAVLGGKFGGGTPSLRDLAAWVDFVNATVEDLGLPTAFVHGACLVFVDAIGLQVRVPPRPPPEPPPEPQMHISLAPDPLMGG